MMKDNPIKIMDDEKIRTKWDEELGDYLYSVIDVIAVLTDSKNPKKYWSDLKAKMKKEGSHLYDDSVQIKMKSSDDKYHETEVVNTKQLLYLIQSVQSPNAEVYKQWLAQVGRGRLDEIADPELIMQRQ